MERKLWTKEELVITLSLYYQLPFGRLNHSTPEVRELAKLIGRSENSIALRLVNFAACDPYILASGRHGMSSGVNVCMPIWEEYVNDKERLFLEAEEIRAKYLKRPIETILGIKNVDLKGRVRETVIKQRVNQNVFRKMVLSNYNQTCAITGINHPDLLIASHIIPWADNEEERLNPENGICLSALYDRAFDKGLITIRPDDFTVCLSGELKERMTKESFDTHFASVANKVIMLPEEHLPSVKSLQYHAEHVFIV